MENPVAIDNKLAQLSKAVSNKLKQLDGKHTETKQSLVYRRALNQLIVMVVLEKESSFGGNSKYQVWLAVVSLDQLDLADFTLHQVFRDKPVQINGAWESDKCPDFDWRPTKIELNSVETSFVIYGDRIAVGNLPVADEDCTCVEFDSKDVRQCEFSVLSPQYLLALTGDELQLLHLREQNVEMAFKVPEVVCFTQAPSHAEDFQTLDIFQVTLLSKDGTLHSLCPLLPQEMVLKDDHFAQILLQMEDLIEDGQISGALKLALVSGKKSLPQKRGYCLVDIPAHTQAKLRPALKELQSTKGPALHLKSICSFPQTYLRVCETEIEMLMSFDQPPFSFDRLPCRMSANFVTVSKIALKCQHARVFREPRDEFKYWLVAGEDQRSQVIMLDLSSLDRLVDQYQDGEGLDMSQFKGFAPIQEASFVCKRDESVVCFGATIARYSSGVLNMSVHSLQASDKVKSLLDSLKEITAANRRQKEDMARVLGQRDIEWEPPTDWQRQIGRSVNGDVRQEDLRLFLEAFVEKYCTHFANLEGQITGKLEYLEKLKAELAKRAEVAAQIQASNAVLKTQIEQELAQVIAQSATVQSKLQAINARVRTLSSGVPDEFILQKFIEKLAADVQQRKAQMGTLARRAQECVAFEQLMRRQIEQMKGEQISLDNLEQMFRWINETKPKVDLLNHEIKTLI